MLIAIPPWKTTILSLQYYNWLLSSLSLCMVILRRTTRDLSDCEIIGDSYDGELIVGFLFDRLHKETCQTESTVYCVHRSLAPTTVQRVFPKPGGSQPRTDELSPQLSD